MACSLLNSKGGFMTLEEKKQMDKLLAELKKNMIFFDTSVLSEFRNGNTVLVCSKKIEFIDSVLKKFQLNIEDAFLTERLFVELIGKGKIRDLIIKNNKQQFAKERNKVFESINCNKNEREKVIISFINFLEHFFYSELKKHIPQESIYPTTINSLKKFCFTENFRSFEEKLLNYGKKLSNLKCEYEIFIKTLVEDSIVRHALDSIEIRQISPKIYAKALDILNQTLTMLMIKYRSSEILYSNINLLMSALKTHIDGKLNHQEKSCPLLRVRDDFVDVELEHFPIRGIVQNDILTPVTVFTKEPEQTVIERLKYNFQAIGVKASIIKSQELVLGRTIILDLDNYTYNEILTGKFVQDNFKTDSGEPIFN